MITALRSADASVVTRVLAPMVGTITAAWILMALGTAHGSPASFALMWAAMAVAMMVPTTMRPMMRAADGSARRAWLFLGGFVLVWLVAGVPAFLLMNAVAWTPFWIALAWIAAGVYQVTPGMHRLVRSCGSVRFTGDPLSYGVRQGGRCVGSCAPVMLAAMVTAMSLPGLVLPLALMLGLTVLLCWEKEPSTSRQALTGVGMAMIVLAVLGVMFLGGEAPHLH